MKNLVIYDSTYGNSQTIAEIIAEGLDATICNVKDASLLDIKNADIIVFGSPTQGGRPTKPMQAFIASLSDDDLSDKIVATFDTRFARQEHTRALGILMKVISFAAPRMATALSDKGATLAVEPEGFYVHDTKGPVNEGEKERARRWASTLRRVYEGEPS